MDRRGEGILRPPLGYGTLPMVELEAEEFAALLEYSCSVPTGVTIGKRWKARRDDAWYLGEYVQGSKRDTARIRWRRIFVLSRHRALLDVTRAVIERRLAEERTA